MKRLSEYAPNSGWSKAKALSEIANLEVVIEGYTIRDGRYGPVAVMSVTLDDGEKEKVITGSKVIMEALKRASEDKAFPVRATFRKRGQAWVIE